MARLRRCCIGNHVRFGLFRYSYPPLWVYNNVTGYTGFLPEMIDLLS
jgi:hypothetical protein